MSYIEKVQKILDFHRKMLKLAKENGGHTEMVRVHANATAKKRLREDAESLIEECTYDAQRKS